MGRAGTSPASICSRTVCAATDDDDAASCAVGVVHKQDPSKLNSRAIVSLMAAAARQMLLMPHAAAVASVPAAYGAAQAMAAVTARLAEATLTRCVHEERTAATLRRHVASASCWRTLGLAPGHDGHDTTATGSTVAWLAVSQVTAEG